MGSGGRYKSRTEEFGEGACCALPTPSCYAIRFTHVGVLVSPVRFGLVAMKSMALHCCERTITICLWHNGFGEDSMRLGARVSEVRVPVVVGRRDDTHERIVSIPMRVFVLLLTRRAPDGINDVLTLRWLGSKVRPNWAAVRPHDWLVVLRAPLRRGRQRSSGGNGLEGDTSQFCVACVANSSLGEVLLAQWAVLI